MEIATGGIKTLQTHWRKLIVLALLLWVGGLAITYGITTYFSELPIGVVDGQINIDPASFTGMSGAEVWNQFQPFVLSTLGVSIIALVALMLIQIMITKMAISTEAGEEMGSQELLNFSFSKFWAYIGTSFVQSIYLFFLYLLFIIPGVIYSIYWMFTTTEVLAGNRTYKAAMNESKRIVKHRWWMTLLYLLVIVLIFAGVQFIVQFLLEFIPDVSIADALISLIGNVFQVIMIVFMTHYYLTRRKHVVTIIEVPTV